MLRLDLDSFVAHVFSSKCKAGNEFSEIKFKIAEATCVTIRLNQEREPVTFKNYQKHQKDTFQYFQEGVKKLYQSDKKKLKDMLCFLENIDYTYNTKSNIITKISDH